MTTALFLGRFQPPHVGHVLTIRRLAKRFDRVVIGVTECEPSMMTNELVVELIRELLPEPEFLVTPVRGSVEGGTAVIDVHFDVCCSGNPAVLAVMKARGFGTEYVERSLDAIYSGTQERRSFVEGAVKSTVAPGVRSLCNFALVPTNSLRPIEKIHRRHFLGLERQVLEAGIMKKPLIVDRVTRAVLDGSHRFAFLVKHGCEQAPVLLCDYDDESIFVGTHLGQRWEFDSSKWISKRHVRATAISGALYAPRTTRHFFPFRKADIPTSLETLRPIGENSIVQLLADASAEAEAWRNREYISEIQRELETLQGYAQEQAAVADWLRRQNEFIAAAGEQEPPST